MGLVRAEVAQLRCIACPTVLPKEVIVLLVGFAQFFNVINEYVCAMT
jgi:hypothetical protein